MAVGQCKGEAVYERKCVYTVGVAIIPNAQLCQCGFSCVWYVLYVGVCGVCVLWVGVGVAL